MVITFIFWGGGGHKRKEFDIQFKYNANLDHYFHTQLVGILC